MARILIAVSSIGYGHVARSRALAKALEQRGHEVEMLAPPPTNAYARAWGVRLHPLSDRLQPITPIVEQWYEKTGKGLIGLRMALEEQKIAQENALLIEREIDFDEYDVIVADESWELLESTRFLKARSPTKVYLTDFLTYKPPTPTALPAALAVNRYLGNRLPRFDMIIHVGLENPHEDNSRWMILGGPRIKEWARAHNVEYIGPLPAVLENEVLHPRKARETLLSSTQNPNSSQLLGKRWALAALGGTRAGYRELARFSQILIEATDLLVTTHSLLGLPDNKPTITLPPSVRPLLPRMLRAFDIALTPAGLTTLATHAAIGLPTLAFPLPGHFEQALNARKAPHALGGCIISLAEKAVREYVRKLASKLLYEGCESAGTIFNNLKQAVLTVEKLL